MELYKYSQIINGSLIKRPSKNVKSPYMADIVINEENDDDNTHLAHCPSLGVSGLLNTHTNLYLSVNDNKTRKSNYTVELIDVPINKIEKTIANTNPQMGNIIFEKLLINGFLPEFKNFKSYKREKKIGDSRIDFYIIKENDEEEYVEIKSVVLCDFEKNNFPSYIEPEISKLNNYKKGAIFPDGYRKNKNVPISERAIKHVKTLSKIKKELNINTSLYFIVQRDDCEYFKPSNKDQFYKECLKEHKDYINIKSVSVKWTDKGICYFNKFLPVIID